MYKIRHLPAATRDLGNIVQYNKILDAVDMIADFPYVSRVYPLLRSTEQEYRRLVVDNYSIFYYVDEEDKLITVARVIYAGRDISKPL